MKVALITSCSKGKLSYPAPVRDFYTGQMFRAVRKLADQGNFDLYVISGKYGLLPSNAFVKPYSHKIKTKADRQAVTELNRPVFKKMLKQYDKIVLIVGSVYLSTVEEFLSSDKVFWFEDHRGSGGFLQIISLLNPPKLTRLINRQKHILTVDDVI